MKFTSIFFTASVSIFEIYLKYYNKRARNMKLVSIIFTASVSIVEIYLKYSEKNFQETEIWKRERRQRRKSPFLQRFSA